MRLLVLPCSDYLAHLVRPVAVARACAAMGDDVLIAGRGRHLAAVAGGLPVADAPEHDHAAFRASVERSGIPDFGSAGVLRTQVAAQCDLIARFRPDAVLSDLVPAARIACAAAGVRHIAIVNADLTRHRRHPFIAAPWPRAWQVGLECWAVDRAWRALARLADEHGACGVRGYDLLAGGDLTLIADWPAFAPTRPLPPGHVAVGPIVHRGAGVPSDWARPDDGMPLFVLTEGSGGAGLAMRLAAALAEIGHVRIAGAAATAAPRHPRIRAAPLVDGFAAAGMADVVICHGGSGTIAQALLAGTPVAAIPSHIEQRWHARRAATLDLGCMIDPRTAAARPDAVAAACRRLMAPAWRAGFIDRVRACCGSDPDAPIAHAVRQVRAACASPVHPGAVAESVRSPQSMPQPSAVAELGG